MKFFVLLLVAVSLAAAEEAGYYHLDIDLLETWVHALEYDYYEVVSGVSDLNTLIHVGQERLDYVYDHFLPHIDLVNKQQYELTESIRKQIKAEQHKVDALHAHEVGVLNLAKDTAHTLEQIHDKYFADSYTKITGVNDDQDSTIEGLQMYLTTAKKEYLDALDANLTALMAIEEDLADHVYGLKTFVAGRKCEYGHAFVDVNTATEVYFKTEFKNAPTVAAYMGGFFAHADNSPHPKNQGYTAYELGKFAVNVYADYFVVVAAELTTGEVRGKVIYCDWMACEDLDKDYSYYAY